MRHLISLVVVLLVSITCKGLERKEIAVSNLSMVVKTSTEQIHWLYGAADFVTKNDDRMDCDASTMDESKTFTISNQVLYIDKGADDEDKDQQRGDGLQGTDKQGAKDADAGRGHGGVGDQQGERRADDHADHDAQHKADAVVRFDKFHSFFFLFSVCFA